MGFKNERILALSIDIICTVLITLILFLIIGFPHYFNYFNAANELNSILDQAKYEEAYILLSNNLNRLIAEFLLVYFIYDVLLTTIFRQTLGKKFVGNSIEFASENKYYIFFIIMLRSALKVVSILLVLPLIIISIVFIFSKKNRTLIDYTLKTTITER